MKKDLYCTYCGTKIEVKSNKPRGKYHCEMCGSDIKVTNYKDYVKITIHMPEDIEFGQVLERN